ncbi:MAG: polymer-forming cytoskeletal protein [Balneolaceae bacterium]|nr:polymer-forming cytoskeletal protein [Balneolaceae bacterium]
MKEDCTYFDKHTSFKGSISSPDEVVVEGHVRGEVEAARKVTILSGAEVRGPIRTAKILLQEGAYHLGALSLSDRPDAISLSDIERLRPARYATSPPPTQAGRSGDTGPGNGRSPEKDDGRPEKRNQQLPESRTEGKEEAVPAGFPGDPDQMERLW